MRMVTCDNGHYFDNKTHTSCPYCTGGAVGNINAGKTQVMGQNNSKTKVLQESTSKTEMIDETVSIQAQGTQSNDQVSDKTVYMGKSKTSEVSSEPVVLAGWLVIISDDGKGSSFLVKFGMNNIGRDKSNHIHIENGDSSISREKHAIVIYDYQNNIFFIKHGEGQYLSYLNGDILLETKELKAHNKIKIGNTELIFIPLCSEIFSWEK